MTRLEISRLFYNSLTRFDWDEVKVIIENYSKHGVFNCINHVTMYDFIVVNHLAEMYHFDKIVKIIE